MTEEQVLLRDTARALLANECPSSLVRAHIDDPAAADPLTARLTDFAGLATGPCTDLCLFIEQTGYVAAPGPFFASTALFGSVLAAAGVPGQGTFGFAAVDKKVHIHDLHATILHLMGIDHTRLTFKFQGRHHRLTDVHGNVVQEILA